MKLVFGSSDSTSKSNPSTKKQPEAPKKKRKQTGLAWFDEPHSTVRGETAMWAAVITQAMMDALSKSNNPELKYHKDEAIRWLTGNSKDFVEVCHLAGMDPGYVRRKAKKSLLNPVAWRAAPGEGRRYHERKAKRKKASAGSMKDPVKANRPCVDTEEKIIVGPWKVQA